MKRWQPAYYGNHFIVVRSLKYGQETHGGLGRGNVPLHGTLAAAR